MFVVLLVIALSYSGVRASDNPGAVQNDAAELVAKEFDKNNWPLPRSQRDSNHKPSQRLLRKRDYIKSADSTKERAGQTKRIYKGFQVEAEGLLQEGWSPQEVASYLLKHLK